MRFMYKEAPDRDVDSGWRFFSGLESDEYSANSENFGIYGVNTIANYDPNIIPLLDAPIGSVFEKGKGQEKFTPVFDWKIPEPES